MNQKTQQIAFIILIVIIGFICFRPSLDNYFIENWDDSQHVLKNEDITSFSGKNLARIFSSSYEEMYQPVTTLTYAINYAIHETRPFGFHLINLLLHCLNAVLIYLILNVLTGQKSFISLLVACFYLTHPFASEPVAWISARSTLLATTFSLAAFFYYIRNESPTVWVLLILYVLAMLSKINAFFLPLAFVAYDLLADQNVNKNSGDSIRRNFMLLLAGVPLIIVAFNFRELSEGQGFWTLLFEAPAKLLWYLNHSFPVYAPSPVYNTPSLLDIRNLIGVLMIALPILLASRISEKSKNMYWMGLLILLIYLFQFLIQYSHGSPIADRYGYFSLLGFAIVIASVLMANYKIPFVKKALIGIVIIITGVNFYISNQYVKAWKEDQSLWTYAEKEYPTNSTAKENLGSWYLSRNQVQEAKSLLVAASALETRNSQVHYNLGNIYFQEQNATKSLEHFTKALNLNPDFKGYLDRAKVYYAIRDYENTLLDVNKSLELEATGEGLHLRGLTKFELNQDGCEDLRLAMGLGAAALSDFVKHCPNSEETN